MRYLSICSGIEAASVAWKPLGWQPAAFAEIEPFPCAVLAHHYPEVPNLGDITRFKEWPGLAIDLLVGGTPCQSFSVAGLRGGLADPRGNLALTYLAIADRYRPRWLLWENVPGVLSSASHNAPDAVLPPDDMEEGAEWVGEDQYEADETADFGCFLSGLRELGYGFAYRILDAQYVCVDGFERAVPQRRERVFVVGHLGDWRRAAAVLFDAASLYGHPAPRREARKDVAPTISARTKGGGGLGTDFDCDGGLIPFDTTQITSVANRSAPRSGDPCHPLAAGAHAPAIAFGGNRQSGPLDVATAVNAHGGPHGRLDFESETFVCAPPLTSNPYGDHESREGLLVAHSLRASGFDASEDGTGRGTPLVPVAFDCKDHGADAGETAPTLRAMGHAGSHANAGGQVAVAFQPGNLRRGAGSEPNEGVFATLKSDHGRGLSDQHPHVATTSAVRRLTPTEFARLQGFPDNYLSQVLYRGKPAADGPIYKALGNSMACNVVRWIGRRIEQVEALSQFSEAAE